MGERVTGAEDPWRTGHALEGAWAGYWRYRVGDYRVICAFQEQTLIVIVVKVGHRSGIYDQGPTAEILSLGGSSFRSKDKKDGR